MAVLNWTCPYCQEDHVVDTLSPPVLPKTPGRRSRTVAAETHMKARSRAVRSRDDLVLTLADTPGWTLDAIALETGLSLRFVHVLVRER